jgi:hypothetical protein
VDLVALGSGRSSLSSGSNISVQRGSLGTLTVDRSEDAQGVDIASLVELSCHVRSPLRPVKSMSPTGQSEKAKREPISSGITGEPTFFEGKVPLGSALRLQQQTEARPSCLEQT